MGSGWGGGGGLLINVDAYKRRWGSETTNSCVRYIFSISYFLVVVNFLCISFDTRILFVPFA